MEQVLLLWQRSRTEPAQQLSAWVAQELPAFCRGIPDALSLDQRRELIARTGLFEGALPELDLAWASIIDALYGLRTAEIESGLLRALDRHATTYIGQQTWIGLDPAVLQTPYARLKRLVAELALAPGARVVDLGSGYGRLGFTLGELRPDVAFTGYELIPERVAESQRVAREFGYSRAEFIHQDLTAQGFAPAPADVYFIYKFGSGDAIRKALADLKTQPGPARVVARDTGTQILIEEEFEWLRRPAGRTELREFAIYEARY